VPDHDTRGRHDEGDECRCIGCGEYHPHNYIADTRGRCICDCCQVIRDRSEREQTQEPAPRCLEHHKDNCDGEVELRSSLTGTGTPIPRCEKHWDERLAAQTKHNEVYPDSPHPPAWFDRAAAGERWNDDY